MLNGIELEGREQDHRCRSLPCAVSYNSSISISGEDNKLLQVHFHSSSEHHVAGQPYAMEANFVHANSVGQLAVVGVFIKEGKSNKFIANLWSQMPNRVIGVYGANEMQISAEDLLPKKGAIITIEVH